MDRELLGKRIRLAREKLRLSQEELAQRISRNQYAVSEYEAGKRRIYAHDLPTIAQALEVPISYFFNEVVESDDLEGLILVEFRELRSVEAKQLALKLLRDIRNFVELHGSDETTDQETS